MEATITKQMEAIKTKLESMDFKALAEILKSRTGVNVALSAEVKFNRYDEPRVDVESQNIKDYAGCMASVYETLVLSNFGGGYVEERDEYWMPIRFSFQYKSGGSNGTNLLTVYYRFATSTWIVK